MESDFFKTSNDIVGKATGKIISTLTITPSQTSGEYYDGKTFKAVFTKAQDYINMYSMYLL